MINRRNFLSTLSASAVLGAVPALAQTEPVVQGSRKRVQLNGEWEMHIDGQLYDVIDVPSSLHPTGFYTLQRGFVLPKLGRGERVFIHFDGITYCGRLTVNGKPLGTMSLYIPHEFEFTALAKEEDNEVEVELADVVPWPDGTGKDEIAMGVNPGWEAYGGIIRDVWAEIRPASFIDNVRLVYHLSADYGKVNLQPRVMISSTEAMAGTVDVVLKHKGVEVGRASKPARLKPGMNDVELAFELKDPALWSPERPNLYELEAHFKAAAVQDSWSCKTGFRDVRVEGREFRLNGKRLVLNGVARHDMWKEQGFTLTRQQQEMDMRMIKMLGCNFVRLVHYPHDRHIVEMAEELGLLVSEEPGYWNMDFKTMPRSEVELGYHILETTIRRDWNSPAVFCWLLSNECTLTTEVLKEGKERCNRLDPIGRLVSAANSMSAKRSKQMFVDAGMDFFDQHPYTFDVQDFNKEADYDGTSKPLTFTEWGGKAIGQMEIVMSHTCDRLMDLVEAGELSGHVFWSWQDMRQYSRIDGEMRDGILESGVVTEGREPRWEVYVQLARLYEGRRREDEMPDTRPEVVPLRWVPWSKRNTFEVVDLQSLAQGPDADRTWSSFKDYMAKYWADVARDQWKKTGEDFRLWEGNKVEVGGVGFQMPMGNNLVRPLVLTADSPEIVIPIGRECQKLHILGHGLFGKAYPLVGKDGDSVATYTVEFTDGTSKEIPLRNGYEVVVANIIDEATRLGAEPTEAQRALLYVKDLAREHYQVMLYSIPVEGKNVARLRCKLNPDQPPLGIFAVTTERSS
jgi:hypothetical protein